MLHVQVKNASELHVQVKKCVKQKHASVFYFPNQSQVVRYEEVNFAQNVHAVFKKSVRNNKCPLQQCPLYRGFSMRV